MGLTPRRHSLCESPYPYIAHSILRSVLEELHGLPILLFGRGRFSEEIRLALKMELCYSVLLKPPSVYWPTWFRRCPYIFPQLSGMTGSLPRDWSRSVHPLHSPLENSAKRNEAFPSLKPPLSRSTNHHHQPYPNNTVWTKVHPGKRVDRIQLQHRFN